ncbi:hypothetical protein NTE05_005175 [Vibrio harveyi]|nr:hypothetical protein [Vibrio harveyi]
MPKHHFLLTYSVSPCRSGDKESRAADKVRRKIAELEEWRKLDNVETAFAGQLYLVSSDIEDKRSEAEEDVTKVFRAVVDELDAYSDVWVSVALSVDKLGACIEFRV